MQPTRRRLLALTSALSAVIAPLSVARPQAPGWPSKPIRIIAPSGPGSVTDIRARWLADRLAPVLGQPIVVENRAGAGGNIGADLVAKSPPDGHTMLLLDVSVLATNPFLFARLPFDVERDLAPVQMLIYAPYILAVSNRLPVKDAAGLVASSATGTKLSGS